MQIQINLDTSDAQELAALSALIAALGGGSVTVGPTPSPLRIETVVAPTAPPPPAAAAIPVSAALLSAEAARVAEEGAADPNAPAVDSQGIPWDARIHASSKAIIADGTWRKKRGVDEVTYGQVFAELQARAAPLPPTGTEQNGAASPVTSTATTPVAPPPPLPATSEQPAPLAPPPPAASAPTAPAAAGANGAARFADFGSFVAAVSAIRSPAIPYLELNALTNQLGVDGVFVNLKGRPDLWDTFYVMAGGQ